MSDTEYMRIRSWEKYQTFNKDRPNWIKLHTSILDDYEYCQLSDTSKILFVHLCIAAAQMKNRIPNDKVWLRKKLSLRKVDLAGLLQAGFIEPYNDGNTDVTQPLHSRERDREETEGERVCEGEPPQILEGFNPTFEQMEAVRKKYDFSITEIKIETEKFVGYYRAKKNNPKDPTAAWKLWMLRQWEFVGGPAGKEKHEKQKQAKEERRAQQEVEAATIEANTAPPDVALAAIERMKALAGAGKIAPPDEPPTITEDDIPW